MTGAAPMRDSAAKTAPPAPGGTPALLNRGSVAIETGLILPFFFMLMWFAGEACFHFQMENRLHRATAALAGLLADLPLDEDEGDTLPDAVRDRIVPANRALLEMMGGSGDGASGIRVSYLDTSITEEEAESSGLEITLSFTVSAGRICSAPYSVPPLRSDVWPEGNLTTEMNQARAKLIRVEGCWMPKNRNNPLWDFVFPSSYYSEFTTLRTR
jgi:hypothetical protein